MHVSETKLCPADALRSARGLGHHKNEMITGLDSMVAITNQCQQADKSSSCSDAETRAADGLKNQPMQCPNLPKKRHMYAGVFPKPKEKPLRSQTAQSDVMMLFT